ncbi:zinc ribbon domain-containing protein [Intestinibacter sp.]
MYILGIVLVVVGSIGIIGTIIWILTDNKKKNIQRQNTIDGIRNQQYQQNGHCEQGFDNNYQGQNKNFDEEQYETIGDLMTDSLFNSDAKSEKLVYIDGDLENSNNCGQNYVDDVTVAISNPKDNMYDYSPNNSVSICPNCNQPIQRDDKFCGNCGKRLV